MAALAGVLKVGLTWAHSATERQSPVAAHREHQADGRALDRQGADVDRDQDHDEVELAEREPAEIVASGSP